MTGTPQLLPETPGAMALEEALRLVHLKSALFLRGDFAAPWAFTSLGPHEYAEALCPGADRVILFHVVLEGVCRVRLDPGLASRTRSRLHTAPDSGEEIVVRAGEAVVLPYSDAHAMADTWDGVAPVPIADLLPPLPWTAMPCLRHGGGGRRTRIVCGYLHCEDLLFHPLLRALPPLIHVKPATAPAAEWLRASAQYALSGQVSGSRLPETLLVDSLRQHLQALPESRKGWLAALRDPLVGRAISLMHEAPAQPWTVETLARKVGASRTVLGERFAQTLGEPPMRYLARWRLQLASHLLRSTSATLPDVAGRVGYQSEAAFSRAFKRGLGHPPATWRSLPRPR